MNSKLVEFLRAQAAQTWVWGRHDCATFLADWYVAATGAADPIAVWRSTYASEADCVAEWGAAYMLRSTRDLCRALGLERTRDPLAGDIGIVAVAAGARGYVLRQLGAIRVPNGWVMPSTPGQRGLVRLSDMDLRVVAAWRIEERG